MKPSLTPLDRELDRLYSNRFSEVERKTKLRLWRTLCQSFFNRYISADATVIDLGAGYCEFINNIRAHRRIAIDLNPEVSAYADPGVEVHNISFAQMADVLGDSSADVVFASNVFEHLRGPEALVETLGILHRTLRPGGLLIIMQPNVRLVGGRFWDFLDHTLPLTERGMTEALHLARFEVRECRARFLPHTTKSRLPKWPILVKLYLAIPAAQWILGKQMLLVAAKTSDGASEARAD